MANSKSITVNNIEKKRLSATNTSMRDSHDIKLKSRLQIVYTVWYNLYRDRTHTKLASALFSPLSGE